MFVDQPVFIPQNDLDQLDDFQEHLLLSKSRCDQADFHIPVSTRRRKLSVCEIVLKAWTW